MGAILRRMTIENGAAEHPQSADIPADIRRSSFGTLRANSHRDRVERVVAVALSIPLRAQKRLVTLGAISSSYDQGVSSGTRWLPIIPP